MLINLFSLDNMDSTFCDLYGIELGKLKQFLDKYDRDKDIVSCFCEYFDFKLDEVDVSENEILCRHFTTAIDAGESIETNGMMSLKQLLSNETVFSTFLKDNGIVIDVGQMLFKYMEYNAVSLAPDDCDSSSKFHFLSVALNHDDGELEAFYSGGIYEMYNYSTIRDYPEFLRKIDDAIGELYGKDKKCLGDKWKMRVNRRLMVEFSIGFTNISYSNGIFQDGMGWYADYMQGTYGYNEYPECALINRWLIRSMLTNLIENEISHNYKCLGVKNPKLINNLKLIDINDEESNG